MVGAYVFLTISVDIVWEELYFSDTYTRDKEARERDEHMEVLFHFENAEPR